MLPESFFRAGDPTCLTPWGWRSHLPLPDAILPVLLARPDSEGDLLLASTADWAALWLPSGPADIPADV